MCPFGTDLKCNWQELVDLHLAVSTYAKCLEASANAAMQMQKCQVSTALSGIIRRQGQRSGEDILDSLKITPSVPLLSTEGALCMHLECQWPPLLHAHSGTSPFLRGQGNFCERHKSSRKNKGWSKKWALHVKCSCCGPKIQLSIGKRWI